jgi:UDP-N-acetylmuramoylalanine--D-glutamate ligase
VELAGKRVLVVGLGRSGIGAARLCAARGARVTATDQRGAEPLAEAVQALQGRVTLELSGHRDASFDEADLIVVSPGVPDDMPQLQRARGRNIPLIGELELSYRFVQAPIVAVTGTNGKSTTTSLLGAMVAATGRPTFVGGNLGSPLVEAVGTEAAGADGALVLELSSFQLETVQRFAAHVALLLNISEDHLDRYPSYEAYIEAKARIFERQTKQDFAVVNSEADQATCRRLAQRGEARILTFQMDGAGEVSAWAEGEWLCVKLPRRATERIPRTCLTLPGRHNVQNALAALLGARLFGADLASCRAAIKDFSGLPHRMELVAQRSGVRYYNDSKATNVGSVVGSLTGFEWPVILIAGGKDKGGDYRPLLPLMGSVVKQVVLIGAAAGRMERALTGSVPLHRALDLEEAVHTAATLASGGDAVVLSPACSSFDMFDSFEHRGRVFADAVLDSGGQR